MGDGVDQDVGQLAKAGFGLAGIERADRRAGDIAVSPVMTCSP
jgi:hypothetical protein